MKITQITFGTILSLIAFCPLPTRAEAVLQSDAELIGVWNLDGSANNLTEENRPGEQTREFKPDGTLVTSGFDKSLPGGNFSVSSS
ncbi:MAG: hypothetical protein ACRER2_18130 [Methylococcales bacterium]